MTRQERRKAERDKEKLIRQMRIEANNAGATFSASDKPLTCVACDRDIGTELCYANENQTVFICEQCYEIERLLTLN